MYTINLMLERTNGNAMQTQHEREAPLDWDVQMQALLSEVDRLLQRRLSEALQTNQSQAMTIGRQRMRKLGKHAQQKALSAQLAAGSAAAATRSGTRLWSEFMAAQDRQGSDLREQVAARLNVSLMQVMRLPVKAARDDLSGLIARVVKGDEVVLVRDARRSDAEGVVIMSETRVLGEAARRGVTLAELVASFAESPITVRALTVPEVADDAEPLSVAAAEVRAS